MARRDTQRAEGRSLRRVVPRSAHDTVALRSSRFDLVSLIEAQNASRLPDLAAVRVGRMCESPFAFLRGAALVMALDLARTPATGVEVQACGDAHLANFGLFASPERQLLFDLNDFDETCPGPFEWDLKRLSTSAVVAARVAGHSALWQRRVATAAVRSYRRHMGHYASMAELELWYAKVDATQAERAVRAHTVEEQVARARGNTSAAALPSLTALAPDGSRRIVDHPPLVSHDGVDEHGPMLHDIMAGYGASLSDDRRALLQRFEVVDFARQVVGVGSVGTRCFVALLMSGSDDPLLLQVKEEQASAIATARRPAGSRASAPRRQRGGEGRRVVDGQRLMQAASDAFLGWASSQGRDFSVRQLRDQKGSIDPLALRPPVLVEYSSLCGAVLARAHARSAGGRSAARIAGYLGSGDSFDRALCRFALAYAEQTVRDHAALKQAVAERRLPAEHGK